MECRFRSEAAITMPMTTATGLTTAMVLTTAMEQTTAMRTTTVMVITPIPTPSTHSVRPPCVPFSHMTTHHSPKPEVIGWY